MRGRRLGPQPRGVRGDAPLRSRPRAAQRPPSLLSELVLSTERLVLRRFRAADLETLERWHADERFVRHLGGEPIDTEAAFARWQAHWDEHGFGQLAVEERSSGDLVGRTGPAFHRVWPDDPEVGWGVDPNRWNEGIAAEAGGASAAWALGELGFRRVVSITTEDNAASLRVMAKLGFSLLTRLDDPVLGLELWVHSLGPSLD